MFVVTRRGIVSTSPEEWPIPAGRIGSDGMSDRHERGVVAIGQFAPGIVCISQFGIGVLSLSQFTLAGFAIAQFAAAYSLVARVGLYVAEGHRQLVFPLSRLLGLP